MSAINNMNDYATRKQQRLQVIAEEYFPPPPEGFFKKMLCNQPTYRPCQNYTKIKAPSPIPLYVRYSRSGNYIFIAMVLIMAALSYLLKKGDSVTSNGGTIVVLAIMISIPIKRLLYRKPLLIVSESGLLFTKEDLAIDWQHIIAAHILAEPGEDTAYYLIIDYYDVVYDYFKAHRFQLGGYDMGYDRIASTIAFFQQKADASQTGI
jgi:hypothetical protein